MNKDNFLLLKNCTDNAIKEAASIGSPVNHDEVSAHFQCNILSNYTDEELCEVICCSGFIPDLYPPDSSDETLYSKLVEVLVCEWGSRFFFNAQYVKEKASYEDVTININGQNIVCDAKSFRLGRSQAAPNVKDFLKLEDIRKWMSRYDKPLGGLVTYPDTHEWSKGSDAYQYCSTKDAPTVMLPYKYLALLLHFKNKYPAENLTKLWDYEKLFPEKLPKKMAGGNRKAYWNVMDKAIMKIIGISQKEFDSYIKHCDSIIRECILANIQSLEKSKNELIAKIKKEDANIKSIDVLREKFTDYRIQNETKTISVLIERIKGFRL